MFMVDFPASRVVKWLMAEFLGRSGAISGGAGAGFRRFLEGEVAYA